MKWYIWKQIGNNIYYFVDIECIWSTDRNEATIYEDWDTVVTTSHLLDAYLSRTV